MDFLEVVTSKKYISLNLAGGAAPPVCEQRVYELRFLLYWLLAIPDGLSEIHHMIRMLVLLPLP